MLDFLNKYIPMKGLRTQLSNLLVLIATLQGMFPSITFLDEAYAKLAALAGILGVAVFRTVANSPIKKL